MTASSVATLSPAQVKEQEMTLDEAKANVASQAFEMKRCLDKNKLMDGLKHASVMLSELKTSTLAPRYYYELYTSIADEMRHLEQYLLEEYRKGRRVEDLYELVQYAGNILPRLYLLVTVGVVYIQTEEQQTSSVRDILRDMVEMCRGIQHPLRGLFLRNYLIQTTKNILPDNLPKGISLLSPTSSENGGETNEGDAPSANGDPGSCVHDSIDYILMNFTEMNKLWVRLQYQGHTKDRRLREQERKELKQLVGANLYALSSLENVDVDLYRNKVLPIILAQVVNSKDPLAQEYLMEVIIHVFPDEFHLATLQTYLDACSSLHEDVDMNAIITALIKRLTDMANTEQGGIGIPPELPLFQIFSEKIEQIIRTLPKTPIDKIIGMQASLVSLALNCYSDKPDYVNIVLKSTDTIFQNFQIDKLQAKSNVANELSSLLKLPVDHYNSLILVATHLSGFGPLLKYLDWEPRRQLCHYIVDSSLNHACLVSDVDKTNKVLELLQTMYREQPDAPDVEEEEEERKKEIAGGATVSSSSGGDAWDIIEADATLMAKFLHNFHSDDPNVHYLMLQAAKEQLSADAKLPNSSGRGEGGGAGARLRRQFTLPALFYNALQLALRFQSVAEEDANWGKKCNKILGGLCRQIVDKLIADEKGELAFRLFLQCALVVDKLSFDQHETLAYECFSQALNLYEECVAAESRAQYAALQLLMTTLAQMTCFTQENHEPLRTQFTLIGSKLFKKPDQARAVAQSSHLYWDCKVADVTTGPLREDKRVADCLKKSVKTANQVQTASLRVRIFIEILHHYVYYFLQPECKSITATVLNGIISKIQEELASPDMASASTEEERSALSKFLQIALGRLRDGKGALETSESPDKDEIMEKFAELTI